LRSLQLATRDGIFGVVDYFGSVLGDGEIVEAAGFEDFGVHEVEAGIERSALEG
jgi:hypothetical protein